MYSKNINIEIPNGYTAMDLAVHVKPKMDQLRKTYICPIHKNRAFFDVSYSAGRTDYILKINSCCTEAENDLVEKFSKIINDICDLAEN